jgi:gag-polypeptide of LTR copia-type
MSSDRYLTSITKLNGENYHDWKFAVSMALHQKGCWGVISGKDEKSSTREGEKTWDTKAEEGLIIIALTVDPSQYTYIERAIFIVTYLPLMLHSHVLICLTLTTTLNVIFNNIYLE